MFGKKIKEEVVGEPEETKRQKLKDIKDSVAQFNRINVKKPYVKVMHNGICLNAITKENPYLFTSLPSAFLRPLGSKYHK